MDGLAPVARDGGRGRGVGLAPPDAGDLPAPAIGSGAPEPGGEHPIRGSTDERVRQVGEVIGERRVGQLGAVQVLSQPSHGPGVGALCVARDRGGGELAGGFSDRHQLL